MCSHCKGWEQCPYRDGDECWFVPYDYESDIGSETVKEMRLQNERRWNNGKKDG